MGSIYRREQNLLSQERGFASLVVGLILIIVISLVTVGFATLIRREQKNALDKQLSTQAFYAAESGVNDAIKAIQSGQANLGDGKKCNSLPATGVLSQASSVINSTYGVSYPCVLVNLTPSKLNHQKVGNSSVEDSNSNSWTVLASTAGATPITTLSIQWNSSDGHNTFPASIPSPAFTKKANWHDGAVPPNPYPAVLKFSITHLDGGGSLTHTSLVNNTFTAFLYPSQPLESPTPTATSANQGRVMNGHCSTTTFLCLTKMNLAGFGSGPYLVHIVSIYDQSDITITALDSFANPISFVNTQAVIDSTGKAQDVLRRIQVSYPLQSNVPLPEALEAQDICKRIQTSASGSDFSDINGNMPPADPNDPCNLEN
ncbi:MAG TPA: pilus assembly PilX N-terminal domain-containing protein [Candidatus Saccharimonadales bacterium]|nr:pilus assembly PilX N-terminal domain-containing protein [Candidatus Saccharimonadales bacterium]